MHKYHEYEMAMNLLLAGNANNPLLILEILEHLPGWHEAAIKWLDARNKETLSNRMYELNQNLPPGYRIVKED